MKINLVLADDHPALIGGIKHTLSGIPTLDIVGTARNSTEIVKVLATVRCDLLITDFVMPGGDYGDGIPFLLFLRRRYPDLKIIVLTTIDNAAMIVEIRKLGVASILSKVDDVDHLISAIHAVYAGASYLSPTLRERMSRVTGGQNNANAIKPLSKRELEVVRLYVSGSSINEIAAIVNRSKQTVSTQKMTAMRKLGLQHDTELFRFAYEAGLMVGSDAVRGGAAPAIAED